ncbi:MAG TPA: M1 family aminopeptidase [Terriglobia bacterium]|jgi:aminopeptidase N|nr:M1 family aminopeptidase [Terriglobia bacterium]
MSQTEIAQAARLLAPRPRAFFPAGAALLLLASWLAPSSAAGQASPSSRFAVTHYAIKATLSPANHGITASARIDFVPESDVSTLSLNLASSLQVKTVTDGAGQNVVFHQEGQQLTVALNGPQTGGKTSSFTVDYGGTLASAEGSPVEDLKLAYVAPEGSYLLYPAHWFPVNENPLNRFSASMSITVPADEVVIASGKAASPVRNGATVTYTFDYEKGSFPGTVIAGKYAVAPATAVGADITLYFKPGHEKIAQSYGDAAGKIFTFFSDKFGALQDHHLALVEIDDDTVGGYSAPGIVALASRTLTQSVNAELMAHEISHQWWRCLVSPATGDDAFLDEGLATYSSALWVEESAGESAFETTMHNVEVQSLSHEEVAPIAQASHLHEFTPEFQSIVFDKGAMVFHMLRWVIGDDAFWKTLQTMAAQYAYKEVSTAQFQKLAEASSKQQLTYFFAQWVDSTGVPQFKRTWAVYRKQTGYQVVGKIEQDLDIFRMPVEIRVYTEGRKPTTARVDMVGTTADFTVDTLTRPLRVVVDPASRLLKYDDQVRVEVEMAKADQLVQQQAYLEAIKQYQQVLELNKNSSLAHYRIGENLLRMRNYNAAVESFRDSLNGDLQPKWVEVWSHLMLGRIFDITGQRDRALNEYQRALQTNDNTQGAIDLANQYIQKPYTDNAQVSEAK